MPTRRHLLTGAAALAALGTSGCDRRARGPAGSATTSDTGSATLSPSPGTTTRSSDRVIVNGTLTSRHTPNAAPTWRIVMPAGGTPRGLVIALHGYGSDGPKMIDWLGLGDHVARTRLAVAAVSGGNWYWHARRNGTDTGAMVVDDFIPLAKRQTEVAADARVGFLGFSMGGYGSLLLASQLGPSRVFGVVAESAALWTDPGASAQGAFDDREDFLAHDVFTRTDVLARLPIRLDCGTSDPFIAANRVLAQRLPQAMATFDPGGHTIDYWHSHAGAQMDWLAAHAAPA